MSGPDDIPDRPVMIRLTADSFRMEARSAPKVVRRVLDNVLEQLADWGLSCGAIGNIQIALAEALNNVVEHAYGFADGGCFALDVRRDAALLICVITDCGAPFPGGQPPAGLPNSLERPLADLPEGGFGWFMIRELTESLGYEHVEGCNRLTLRFRVE